MQNNFLRGNQKMKIKISEYQLRTGRIEGIMEKIMWVCIYNCLPDIA